MNKKKNPLLSGPYLVWTAAFIIIPLVLIVYYGLTSSEGTFTWANIMEIATPENRKALWLALLLSLISTVLCLIMAYPLAMILSSLKFNATGLIVMIFIIPMWMNFLLRTLAWQTPSSCPEYYQYPLRHRAGYGVQLSALYAPAHL